MQFLDWIEIVKGVFKAFFYSYLCLELGQLFFNKCFTYTCYSAGNFVLSDWFEFTKLLVFELGILITIVLGFSILIPVVKLISKLLLYSTYFGLQAIRIAFVLAEVFVVCYVVYYVFKNYGFWPGVGSIVAAAIIVPTLKNLSGYSRWGENGGSSGTNRSSKREANWDEEHQRYLNQQKSIQQHEAAEQARRNEPSPWT